MCPDKIILYCFASFSSLCGVFFLIKKIGLGENEITIPKIGTTIKTGQAGLILFLVGAAFFYFASTTDCNSSSTNSDIYYRDKNGDGYGDINDFSKIPKDGYVNNSEDNRDNVRMKLEVDNGHSTHKWLTAKCATNDKQFNIVVTLNLLSPLKGTPNGKKKIFIQDDAKNGIIRFANNIQYDNISNRYFFETADFDNKLLQLTFSPPNDKDSSFWQPGQHKLKFTFFPIASDLVSTSEFYFTICCNCDDNNCQTNCNEVALHTTAPIQLPQPIPFKEIAEDNSLFNFSYSKNKAKFISKEEKDFHPGEYFFKGEIEDKSLARKKINVEFIGSVYNNGGNNKNHEYGCNVQMFINNDEVPVSTFDSNGDAGDKGITLDSKDVEISNTGIIAIKIKVMRAYSDAANPSTWLKLRKDAKIEIKIK